MRTIVAETSAQLGAMAGHLAAETIRAALAEQGSATIVLATGASQFDTLKTLAAAELDWSRVTVFHLDEYVGIAASHPASFRRYLSDRFLAKVPPVAEFVAIAGDAPDPAAEVARLNARLGDRRVDVALVGIGENGHLAFNDPPADFETNAPYLIVELDRRCREQQLGEGWFPTLEDVPRQAISMSIRRIMACTTIVASVPDLRKAEAVRNALEGPVSPLCPASILREHPRATLFLDRAAASLLKPDTIAAASSAGPTGIL